MFPHDGEKMSQILIWYAIGLIKCIELHQVTVVADMYHI